ncbi:MAG: tetratricopeptide repeat protein [Candidatus Latescibacteria bacterium]|nr:tetratricopeptide repeat protein [Candidatus Latescibacterota bacterium]
MRGYRARIVRWLPGVLVLLGASWFTAAPSLRGPFLFDDLNGVIDVASLYTPSDILDGRFWRDEPTGYRPVRYASLILDWRRGGGSPAAFHATNLALHAACGLLLWSLLRRLRPGSAWPLLAAVLFVVHPLQTAAVSFISGRKDLLAAVFYLAALHANVTASRRTGRPARILFAGAFLLCAGLSFLSKEIALTLPLAALLCDRAGSVDASSSWRGWASLLRRRAWFYGILATGGLLGLVEKLVLRPGTQIPLREAVDLTANLPLVLRTLAWHVRKIWLPWPQAADLRGLFPDRVVLADGTPGPASWSELWNGGGVAVTLAGLAMLGGWLLATRLAPPRARGAAAAGVAFFLIALLPVLNLVKLNEPVAEHYLYLPLAGWAVALAVWLDPGAARSLRMRRVRLAVVVVLPLALAVAARGRSAVWASPERLWTSVVESNRSGNRGWNNVALIRLAAGDSVGGEAALRRALALEPGEPRITANLMAIDHAHGRFDAAARLGEAALAKAPANKLLLSLQGRVLLAAGRPDAARALLERLVGADDRGDLPDDAWRSDLGAARLLTGDAPGAVAALETAAAERPDVAGTWTNLGAALIALQRHEDAETALRRALALPQAGGQAHRNLAVVLLRTGRGREAAAELAAARDAGVAIPASLAEAVAAAAAEAGLR